MTLFVKVDLTIFIRFRPTCDNRLLVHQNKELQRALVRACVCVCVRACVGGYVCAYVRACTYSNCVRQIETYDDSCNIYAWCT